MFVLGLGIGNAVGDAPAGNVESPTASTEEIVAERDAAESQLATAQSALATVTQELQEVKAQQSVQATEDSPSAEQPAAQKPKRQPLADPVSVDFSGDLGQYGVADVVVQEASDGTFEVIAVITNNGPEVDALYLTAKVLKAGQVAGTAEGVASFGFGEFNSGATEAVTFVGADDYEKGADFVKLEISFENRDG